MRFSLSPLRLGIGLLILFASRPAFTQAVLSHPHMSYSASLPDAPGPVLDQQPQPDAAAQQPTSMGEKIESLGQVKLGPRFDPKALDRSQAGLRLSAKDKIVLSFEEQTTVFAFSTEFLSAGWAHLIDGHPKYGSDSAGFGEKLGAAAIRQSSQAVFSDGVFAAVLHEDPRFYRLGSGPVTRRMGYAASRMWRTRTDSGEPSMNYSLLAGYGAAAAMTMAYYPHVSSGGGRAAITYGYSLLGNVAGNQFHEFWPDVRRKLFHRKRPTP
jgi:hypothetical protein